MSKIQTWPYIIVAVSVALLANSISAVWAGKENKFSSWWFLAVLLISPFVFLTFGYVTSKLGLALGSGTIDSLLTVSTIFVGLFIFGEAENLSLYQYAGVASTILGIILMQIKN